MSSEHPRVAATEFRRVCGRFATGVTVATVSDAAGKPHGLTVNSFTSVSLHPPLVLVCLGHEASALRHFREATHFGINILNEDQQEVSNRFARKGRDRFDGLEWEPGRHGIPLLTGTLAHMECALHRRVEMGDHDIFVGEVVHAHVAEGNPLLYFAGAYRKLELL